MVRVFSILLQLCLMVSLALGNVLTQFEDGKNSYLYGDFTKVIKFLGPLFSKGDALPDGLELGKAREALEMLGLAHFYLGDETAAAEIFEKLIVIDEDRSLNPVTAPPEAIAFYKRIKADFKGDIARRRKIFEDEQDRRRKAEAELNQRVIQVESRRNSQLVALVPFGVGQFQNGDSAWGGVFLGTELVATSLSVAFFFAAENLRQSDGFYDRQDVGRARAYRVAQFATGGAAVALMVGGIIHAWATFKPNTRSERKVIKSGAPARVTPTLTPNGLGVMFEF